MGKPKPMQLVAFRGGGPLDGRWNYSLPVAQTLVLEDRFSVQPDRWVHAYVRLNEAVFIYDGIRSKEKEPKP